jgi:hypothetical protein
MKMVQKQETGRHEYKTLEGKGKQVNVNEQNPASRKEVGHTAAMLVGTDMEKCMKKTSVQNSQMGKRTKIV